MDNPTVFVRSINVRAALRSISFNGRNSEPTMIRFGSRSMSCKASISLKGRELDTKITTKSPSLEKENKVQVKSVTFKDVDNGERQPEKVQLKSVTFKDEYNGYHSPTPLSETTGSLLPQLSESAGNLNSSLSDSASNSLTSLSEPENRRNEAAIRLQKVYKSFRTRRRLADCAVLAEQRWWKALDFAELKRSSISFFQIEKPETAFSRWSRARTRAAKVGKGLSKDEKARKLALQHWLEAIDPRHRYGHNLQFYYVTWLHCNSRQPFFYWLDIGDGKEVNLERCPRSKLHQQCIKYLGPKERSAYEVIVDNGKLVYKQSGQVIDTTGEPRDVKWIFVLSTSKTLYVGQKNKGRFQHSSFLAGGATLSAGRLEAENGILKRSPSEEGEFTSTCPSRAEFSQAGKNLDEEQRAGNAREAILRMHSKLAKLEIPKREDTVDDLEREGHPQAPRCSIQPRDFPSQYYYYSDEDSSDSDSDDDYETDDESLHKQNLFDEDQEDERPIPEEVIVQRIDSHKGMNSYQLAKQLSWTTGAGPRIGCIKDYPSELRLRILEQACLYRPKGVSRSVSIMSRPQKQSDVIIPHHHRRSSAII